jgi:hypothetical protein
VRVVVRRDGGADSSLGRDRAVDRGRRLRMLWWLIPAEALILGATAARLAGDLRDHPGSTIVALALMAALIPVCAWWVMRRHRRVATGVPGRLWHSGDAAYLGPFDDLEGLPGSSEFAARHRVMKMVGVRLVVTADGLVAVPIMPGHEWDHLRVPFAELGQVEVNFGAGKERAVGITRHDDRRASFKVKPDEELVRTLERLGATVVEG